MTDPFDWIDAEYYWQDDMYYMDLRDDTDPSENPFANDERDMEDDYPFDDRDYETLLEYDES